MPIYFSCNLRVTVISRFSRSKYRMASMSSKSVRSSVVPYFSCPARLRSWNERTTDATTVSSDAEFDSSRDMGVVFVF